MIQGWAALVLRPCSVTFHTTSASRPRARTRDRLQPRTWRLPMSKAASACSKLTRRTAIARARPADIAGAAALLRYAAEYEDEGCEWPSEPETEDGGEEWMITFHQSLAAALEALFPG